MLALGANRECLLVNNQMIVLSSLLNCALMREERKTAVQALHLMNLLIAGPNRSTPTSIQLSCTPSSTPTFSTSSAPPSSNASKLHSKSPSRTMTPHTLSSYCLDSSSTIWSCALPASRSCSGRFTAVGTGRMGWWERWVVISRASSSCWRKVWHSWCMRGRRERSSAIFAMRTCPISRSTSFSPYSKRSTSSSTSTCCSPRSIFFYSEDSWLQCSISGCCSLPPRIRQAKFPRNCLAASPLQWAHCLPWQSLLWKPRQPVGDSKEWAFGIAVQPSHGVPDGPRIAKHHHADLLLPHPQQSQQFRAGLRGKLSPARPRVHLKGNRILQLAQVRGGERDQSQRQELAQQNVESKDLGEQH